MTSLLTRIESGQGADEALDLDIIKTLLPKAVVMRADTDEEGKVIPGKSNEYTHWRLTSSLDAALSLVERMLPGWPWIVYHDGAELISPKAAGPIHYGRAPTPARSLLAALLRALESSP